MLVVAGIEASNTVSNYPGVKHHRQMKQMKNSEMNACHPNNGKLRDIVKVVSSSGKRGWMFSSVLTDIVQVVFLTLLAVNVHEDMAVKNTKITGRSM